MRTLSAVLLCLALQACSDAAAGDPPAEHAKRGLRTADEYAAVPAPAQTSMTPPSTGDALTDTAPVMAATSITSCSDGKRYCRDMDDCADANYHLQQCGLSRLDGDHDGVPCESICGSN